MPRSKRSYATSARKAAATRAANVLFAKRSAAAKKGWATRDFNLAEFLGAKSRRKAGRHNPKPGETGWYRLKVFGKYVGGRIYDFRGLTKAKRAEQLMNVYAAAPGKVVRLHIMLTDETLLQKLYRPVPYYYMARHKRGTPYYFWTNPKRISNTAQYRLPKLDAEGKPLEYVSPFDESYDLATELKTYASPSTYFLQMEVS